MKDRNFKGGDFLRADDVLTPSERTTIRETWLGRALRTFEGETWKDQFPNLGPSLAALIEQGYGTQDIANMFGVCRQTVSAWIRGYGLCPIFKQNQSRVWSTLTGRFVPITARMGARLGVRFTRNSGGRPQTASPSNIPRITHCIRGHNLDDVGVEYLYPDGARRWRKCGSCEWGIGLPQKTCCMCGRGFQCGINSKKKLERRTCSLSCAMKLSRKTRAQ